jgi:hypothetical protein
MTRKMRGRHALKELLFRTVRRDSQTRGDKIKGGRPVELGVQLFPSLRLSI